MIKEVSIRMLPQEAAEEQLVIRATAKAAGISYKNINDIRVVRRSVDARKKPVMLNLGVKIAYGDDTCLMPAYQPKEYPSVTSESYPVVIVGAGPAGLFAALKAIEHGMRPIVLERGKDVDSRRLDLAALSRTGEVDTNSNYCFGEGGAGAYSDGKLFTRSKKRGNVREILEILHQHGARDSVLTDSHPHIGSDRLPHIIKSIREKIKECGGEVHFNTRVVDLLIENEKCVGVVTERGEAYHGDVVLATGHSARDVYEFLDKRGVEMEAKGIAIGVRLEHPQHLIDKLQYHTPDGRGEYLPAAEYNFVTQVDGRGVYSFCMCPGGVVVPAMSDKGELVVNGMSASARAGAKANSGMVVQILPGDFEEYKDKGVFEILELQRDLERKFYKASGETFNAPAQRMQDFVEGKMSKTLPSTSYVPGVHPARMDELLPPAIAKRLQQGFRDFNRKCKGFLTNEAMLIGLESRTSSPLRVPRDAEEMCHIHLPGLYPAGEGAGYAGGIVSAAIDGQRCIDAIAEKIGVIKS